MRSIVGLALLVLLTSWWSPASAAGAMQPASNSHDTAAYIYDAPALLSSLDSVARDARVSPSGPGAASWVSPVSVRDRGVAAKTAPSTAIRPVGSVLGHVDDVMANPRLLEGVHPAQLENIMRGTPGWEFGVFGRGRSAGSGWTARELNSAGTDFTGRYIQWSPGSPRHFGGAPYWKISSGELGTVRFPQ